MKTLRKIKARFWRPGLTKAVHRYCSSCLTCAKCKSRPKPKAALHPIPSGNPMQRIHIDIVGPSPSSWRGNRYILIAQCSFTRWAEAFAIPNKCATTCARVLVKNCLCRYGVPDSIHSDQGRNFESQVFEDMCHLLEINKTRSIAHQLEGNGQKEGGGGGLSVYSELLITQNHSELLRVVVLCSKGFTDYSEWLWV